jgi:Fe-S cluster assembly protein SufD
MNKTIDPYLFRFEQLKKERYEREPSFLQELRREAISRFADLGFPATRLEDWKYTNVEAIAKMRFEFAADGRNGVHTSSLKPYTLGESCQLVFVNGSYAPEFSNLAGLPEGTEVRSLADVLEKAPEELEPHLGRYASFKDHPFVALNTAFIGDGVFVKVPAGTIVETPIHVIFVTTPTGEATVSHLRNLIVAGDNSQVTVIERYVGLGSHVYFNNLVTEVVAGDNAVVNHYKLQQESEEAFHIATLQYHQTASSNIASHNITVGGGLSRNDVNAVLDGEGGDCILNGFYLMTGRQHVDNHTRIRHAKPHCTSLEVYKGILNDHARGVFNGRIIVDQEAQKTNAIQTNRNLLLSDGCLVNSNPQLEIYADDVKCTHGSTIGQLDAESLFYLRSRGLSFEVARAILIQAFAGEVLDQIKVEPIRKEVVELMSNRLRYGRMLPEAQ